MLGEARSKFGSISGPSSGITMNGAELKTSGNAEVEKLDKEIDLLVPGGTGYSFFIG
jgi:hypothetical protein